MWNSRRACPFGVALGLLLLQFWPQAASRNFAPDVVFKGSSLTGWRPLGPADWRADNGEIIGTAKTPGGGWLMIDKSYQDIAIAADFRCAAGCKAGILLRAEKAADGGIKGIFVSLTEGDLGIVQGHPGRAGQRADPRGAAAGVGRAGADRAAAARR